MTEVSLFFSTNIAAMMMSRKNTDKKTELFDLLFFEQLFCFQKCQNGLECKKMGFWSLHKCTAKPPPPTEEPGSGDMSI